MRLQEKTVSDIVKGWHILYPGNRKPAELAFISAKFFKKLAPVFNDETFRIAAELVEDEQEFFPTLAHMKKMQGAAVAKFNRDRGQLALPEKVDSLTPEEIRLNKKRIKIFLRQINGEISQEQADKEMGELLA